MKDMSKVCYSADVAPSTPVAERSIGFTENQWNNRQAIIHTESTFKNFAILECQILSLERLHLSASGHDRIQYTRNPETKTWQHQWLAP
jgi:hypothetical protein